MYSAGDLCSLIAEQKSCVGATMSSQALPKVADAEKESLYGYVFGVSGPGELPVHVVYAIVWG